MTMAIPAVLICVSLSIVYTACVQHETEQLVFHTYQQAPVDVEADSKCVNWGTGELQTLYGSLHSL